MNRATRIPEYLQHIIVGCNRIIRFAKARTSSDFRSDLMLQGAILHAVQFIGEAAVRIRMEDEHFMREHGLQEFTRAIGMRNRLAHEYDAVDLEIAWDTVSTSIPALRERAIDVLFELGHNPDPDSLHF